MLKPSVVICSYKRPDALRKCLESLKRQTVDFELILCTERGNLVELKEKSWRKASGDVIVFIDDDIVIPNTTWLEEMVEWLEKCRSIVGITGPTIVPPNYLKNRDILKDTLFRKFYNWFFLDGLGKFPGTISKCGVNTWGGNYFNTKQTTQWVDFLEPSQFAVRKKDLETIGGFDLGFTGVAEWCDVDLCYRLKKFGNLMFDPKLWVFHYPVKGDVVYNLRLETKSRYENYCRWADRYVSKSWKHWVYRAFLKVYFFMKGMRWI